MNLEISTKFKELIHSSTPKKKRKQNKFGMLQSLQDEIKEARKLGYSFKEISEYLIKSGAQVATHQIQGYCREVLKEKPLYRRSKKSDKKLETISNGTGVGATNSQHTASGSSLHLGGASVTQAPQKSSPAVAPNRVGPRPGFRVARDDL